MGKELTEHVLRFCHMFGTFAFFLPYQKSDFLCVTGEETVLNWLYDLAEIIQLCDWQSWNVNLVMLNPPWDHTYSYSSMFGIKMNGAAFFSWFSIRVLTQGYLIQAQYRPLRCPQSNLWNLIWPGHIAGMIKDIEAVRFPWMICRVQCSHTSPQQKEAGMSE